MTLSSPFTMKFRNDGSVSFTFGSVSMPHQLSYLPVLGSIRYHFAYGESGD